jgi:uncharacterized protein YaeQ
LIAKRGRMKVLAKVHRCEVLRVLAHSHRSLMTWWRSTREKLVRGLRVCGLAIVV